MMPSYRRWKQTYPNLSTWMIIQNIIFERDTTTPLPSESKRVIIRTSAYNNNNERKTDGTTTSMSIEMTKAETNKNSEISDTTTLISTITH